MLSHLPKAKQHLNAVRESTLYHHLHSAYLTHRRRYPALPYPRPCWMLPRYHWQKALVFIRGYGRSEDHHRNDLEYGRIEQNIRFRVVTKYLVSVFLEQDVSMQKYCRYQVWYLWCLRALVQNHIIKIYLQRVRKRIDWLLKECIETCWIFCLLPPPVFRPRPIRAFECLMAWLYWGILSDYWALHVFYFRGAPSCGFFPRSEISSPSPGFLSFGDHHYFLEFFSSESCVSIL